MVEPLLGLLMRFGAHQVADAEPLLVDLADRNHRQHGELAVGAGGAAAAVINGAVAFRRVVDDDKEFALMAGFVAFARSHASIPVPDAGTRGRPDKSARFKSAR